MTFDFSISSEDGGFKIPKRTKSTLAYSSGHSDNIDNGSTIDDDDDVHFCMFDELLCPDNQEQCASCLSKGLDGKLLYSDVYNIKKFLDLWLFVY